MSTSALGPLATGSRKYSEVRTEAFPKCYGQGGAVCAEVPKPIAALDKHAAVGGVAIVTGQLGSTVGTSALVAEWMTGKVQRVALTKSGSTYHGSAAPDWVEESAAGLATADDALLVGDWGTGTIYRVART